MHWYSRKSRECCAPCLWMVDVAKNAKRVHQGGTIRTPGPLNMETEGNSYLPYCRCERTPTSEKLWSAAAPQVPDIISEIRLDPQVCRPQLESWTRAVERTPPRGRSPAADPGKRPNKGPVRSPRRPRWTHTGGEPTELIVPKPRPRCCTKGGAVKQIKTTSHYSLYSSNDY